MQAVVTINQSDGSRLQCLRDHSPTICVIQTILVVSKIKKEPTWVAFYQFPSTAMFHIVHQPKVVKKSTAITSLLPIDNKTNDKLFCTANKQHQLRTIPRSAPTIKHRYRNKISSHVLDQNRRAVTCVRYRTKWRFLTIRIKLLFLVKNTSNMFNHYYIHGHRKVDLKLYKNIQDRCLIKSGTQKTYLKLGTFHRFSSSAKNNNTPSHYKMIINY